MSERCGECRETFPSHLFAPVITSVGTKAIGTKTVCPLCAWTIVCSAHGMPPSELLPRGEQARAMVEEAAGIMRGRGRAEGHPAKALLEALEEASTRRPPMPERPTFDASAARPWIRRWPRPLVRVAVALVLPLAVLWAVAEVVWEARRDLWDELADAVALVVGRWEP
jgi:hypothetical protein